LVNALGNTAQITAPTADQVKELRVAVGKLFVANETAKASIEIADKAIKIVEGALPSGA
jgi:hypothetical protein